MKREKWKVISFIMITSIIISGIAILMLIMGQMKAETLKGYVKTEANLIELKEHRIDLNDTITYYQRYEYKVNGKKYQIETDYSSNYVKKQKLIKYNPENPSEAILPDGNIFLVIGLMVVFFVMLPIGLSIASKVSKTSHIIMDCFITVMFFLLGVFTYIIMCFDILEFDFATAYNIEGFGLLIPFFWILMGVILLVSILYAVKEKKYDEE